MKVARPSNKSPEGDGVAVADALLRNCSIRISCCSRSRSLACSISRRCCSAASFFSAKPASMRRRLISSSAMRRACFWLPRRMRAAVSFSLSSSKASRRDRLREGFDVDGVEIVGREGVMPGLSLVGLLDFRAVFRAANENVPSESSSIG